MTSRAASPAISVIICTWNRAGLLAKTMASLRSQVGLDRDAVEIIVVDNNSTDDTPAVVAAAAATWSPGTLRYVFEKRQGKQFALNTGIDASRAPVLAFTDDDIVFPSDWLQRVATVFADASFDLAGGRTLIAWPQSGRPDWYADDMLAVLAGVDLGQERLDPAPADYAPGGSNLIARRTLFDRFGPFSETCFRHMDHEFGIRCNERGARVVYVPELIVYAPVDSRCLTRRYFRRWAFKAGISRSGGIDAAGTGLPRVPRWIYRQLAQDFAFCASPRRRVPEAAAFSREMRMWRAWGTVCNAWHAWLAPGRHAAWVQRHSQKKDGLY